MKRVLTTVLAALALAIPVAGPANAQAAERKVGNWRITEHSSPLTGARTIAATLDSSNELSNMLGYPQRAGLVIRCGEGGLVVYVDWPQVVTYDGRNFAGSLKTVASWRVDDGRIETNFWDIASTGNAAGEFKPKNAARLLATFVGATSLAVRLTGRQTQDAAFDLTGIDEVATNAATACGMTLKKTR